MSNVVGGTAKLEGEKEYRDALKKIALEAKYLNTEMKSVNASYDKNDDSIEALNSRNEVLIKQLELQNNKVNILERAVKEASETYDEGSKEIMNWKQKLLEAQVEVKLTTREIEKNEKKIQEASETTGEAEEVFEELADAFEEVGDAALSMEDITETTEDAVEELADAFEESGNAALSMGDIIKANLLSDAIKSGLKQLADSTRELVSSSVDVGSGFEASMSQVAATMGMTADEINAGSEAYEKLRDAAKECGANTKYSASEAADALNYLALAGYDANASIEALPNVLTLASAGNLDLAYASDLLTDSMAALGKGTDDMGMFMDEMAKTSQKSNTSVAQLGEATLVCAGAVYNANMSLETMNTTLGVLANNGIKGSEAGTKLRNILLSLSAPTDTAKVKLDELGIAVYDNSGNMRDLEEIMIDLNAQLGQLSSEEKNTAINTIFNKTDISAVNALLKSTTGEFSDLKAEIESASGAAGDMADTMENNLKGKLTQMNSAAEAVGITIYEKLDEPFKNASVSATQALVRINESLDNGRLNQSMEKMAEAIENLLVGAIDLGEDALPVVIDGLAWIIDNSGLIVSGIAAIGTGFATIKGIEQVNKMTNVIKALCLSVKEAGGLMSLLGTAMIGISNPAALAAAGVAAVVAGLVVYNATTKEAESETQKLCKASDELIESSNKVCEGLTYNSLEAEEEYGSVRVLSDKLFDLAEQSELTAYEQNEMASTIEMLNEKCPELNLHLDEQTGLLNKTREEVDDLIDGYLKMAKAQKAQEEAAVIAGEIFEHERSIDNLQKQREETIEELTKAQEKLREEVKRYNEEMDGSNTITYEFALGASEEGRAVRELTSEVESLNEQIDEENACLTELNNEYSDIAKYMTGEAYDSIETVKAQMIEWKDTTYEVSNTVAESINSLTEAFQEECGVMSETIQEQMGLFDEFSDEVDMTGQDIINNLKSQVEGMERWSDNIVTLADRGINKGLLRYLSEMGPKGAGYVAELVKLTDEQLMELNEAWETKLEIVDITSGKIADVNMNYSEAMDDLLVNTSETAERMNIEFSSMAVNCADGFNSAFRLKLDGMIVNVKSGFGRLVSSAKNVLGIRSPSKVFAEMADYCVQGYDNRLKEGFGEISDNMKEYMDFSNESAILGNTSISYGGMENHNDYDMMKQCFKEAVSELKLAVYLDDRCVGDVVEDMVLKRAEYA